MRKIVQQRKHWWVGLGGTFDHFHKGHEAFLEFAAKQGENLLIGITAQHLTQHKLHPDTIEPFRVRAKQVAQWCKKNGIHHEIIQLYDIYGPTLEDKRLRALVVSEETIAGADTINQARVAAQMNELPVYICPLVKNEFGNPLHADQIRAGLVDRQGKSWLNKITTDQPFNQLQRTQLQQPIGNIVPTESIKPHSVLVGDKTLIHAIELAIPFSLAVTDGKIQRTALTKEQEQTIDTYIQNNHVTIEQTANQAGQISQAALDAISVLIQTIYQQTFDSNTNQTAGYTKHYSTAQPQSKRETTHRTTKPTILQVDGEEDLLSLVLILGLPLGTYLYYGQPGNGLIEVYVSEAVKQSCASILQKS